MVDSKKLMEIGTPIDGLLENTNDVIITMKSNF